MLPPFILVSMRQEHSVYRSMPCPRCGTPLAIIGDADRDQVATASDAISQVAAALTARLQQWQPRATIPAYVEVRERGLHEIVQIVLAWPPEHHSVLTPDDWANVRPLLQQLHRCVPLARLY